jgi:abortive infection bacteriophage resistance protein
MPIFDKAPLTTEQHIALLQGRGLIIEDKDSVLKYLQDISFYRFLQYCKPFETVGTDHQFLADTSFDNIVKVYIFDRKLRALTANSLERIEVSVKAQLNNRMSLQYGAHWYCDAALFKSKELHCDFMAEIERSVRRNSEAFIKNYYDKDFTPEHPPSWMVMEVLSFGQVSKLYASLKGCDEKTMIARYYTTPVAVFESWLLSLVYTRNICAHHNRLWNRVIVIKPKLPTREKFRILEHFSVTTPGTPFAVLSICNALLSIINPKSDFADKVKSLISDYEKHLDFEAMGLCEKWDEERIWSY